MIKRFFKWLKKIFKPEPKLYVSVKPGHGEKLWELDTKTWDLYELDTDKKHEAVKGNIYVTAINEKNAIKKLNKVLPKGTVKK